VTWRVRLVGLAIALLALFIWRAQLFVVSRPGDRPRALALIAEPARRSVAFDVMLPAVPIGETRFSSGGAVRLVHYWAPWERHAASQAIALDSLLKNEALIGLRGDVVCFDPFPSVMRYVSRLGLRLGLALDRDRRLARALPCPSLPYTYVLDRRGRIAAKWTGWRPRRARRWRRCSRRQERRNRRPSTQDARPHDRGRAFALRRMACKWWS